MNPRYRIELRPTLRIGFPVLLMTLAITAYGQAMGEVYSPPIDWLHALISPDSNPSKKSSCSSEAPRS